MGMVKLESNVTRSITGVPLATYRFQDPSQL